MSKQLRINIRLANYPPIAMTGLTHEEEEVARTAEKNVNTLWESWCQRWRLKSGDEVMAMVAFRFAQLYFGRVAASEEALDTLRQLDSQLRQAADGLREALRQAGADSQAGAADGDSSPHDGPLSHPAILP